MSDLPSRQMVHHTDNIHDFPTYMERVLLPLAFAYRSGELKTAAEWRETIDIEVAIEAWWTEFATNGQYNPATRAAIAAAVGDGDDWDNQPEGYEHMAIGDGE